MSPAPTRSIAWALSLALAAGAPLAGCSVALVDGPPPRQARAPGFTCTSSPTWPVTDIGLALAGLGAATYGMAKDSGAAIAAGLAATAAFGISAAMGARRANACNRALGHPYVPHAPTAQPDMMPEMPFGLAGTARSRARKDPDAEDGEAAAAAAQPGAGAPAPAKPPSDLVP